MEDSLLILFVIGLVLVSMSPKLFGGAQQAAGFALTMKQLLPVAAAGGVAYVVLSSRDTEGKGIVYAFALTHDEKRDDAKTRRAAQKLCEMFNIMSGYDRVVSDDPTLYSNLQVLLDNIGPDSAIYIEQPSHKDVKLERPKYGLYTKGAVDRNEVLKDLTTLAKFNFGDDTGILDFPTTPLPAPKLLVNETHLAVFDLTQWNL